jgi:hypothetical protein
MRRRIARGRRLGHGERRMGATGAPYAVAIPRRPETMRVALENRGTLRSVRGV